MVLESTDCFVNESVLTGESFPVEKTPGVVARTSVLTERANCVFLGTNVRSGTARCLVVATGTATQFGAIAHRLTLRPPETEFDRGLRRFGYLLTSAMLVMVLVVFAANMLLGRPPIETLLFSIALAVGLSPELLPAILFVNLARGAQLMARHNFLSDVPAVGLADDSVDPELVDRPRRWDMRFIGRFMIVFGVLSSFFDFVTFGALLGFFAATPELFRTGCFVESLLTELVIALVVRTRRPFFRSQPGTTLLVSTAAIIVVTFVIPFLPFAGLFGFTALPGPVLLTLMGITVFYIGATELAKARFYRGVP